MKTFLKFASLFPICFLTWLGTSALLAQQQARKRVSTPPPVVLQRGKETMQTFSGDDRYDRAQALIAPSEQPVASTSLKAYEVNIQDGMAMVNAKASLMDQIKINTYVWRLSFLDAKGKTLDQMVYDQQVFGMEADGVMEASFSDAVNLVPGAKMVQLSLFAFPPTTPLVNFKDDTKASQHLVIRGVHHLEN